MQKILRLFKQKVTAYLLYLRLKFQRNVNYTNDVVNFEQPATILFTLFQFHMNILDIGSGSTFAHLFTQKTRVLLRYFENIDSCKYIFYVNVTFAHLNIQAFDKCFVGQYLSLRKHAHAIFIGFFMDVKMTIFS